MSCKIPPLLSHYSNKVNIYDHCDFIPLAAIKPTALPLPAYIVHLTTNYGQPYPVPTHSPPFPSCDACKTCKTCKNK